MSGWIRVCAQSELLPGEFKVAWDGDTAIAVFNIDGELYAVEDICTHDGGELAGGDIEGVEVECPRHGARFDLRTGRRTGARRDGTEGKSRWSPYHAQVYTRDDRGD